MKVSVIMPVCNGEPFGNWLHSRRPRRPAPWYRVPLVARLEQWTPPPFGQSLFAVLAEP